MSYKKKYQSIYGAKNLLTAPQYLTELIIKKRADKKGIKLPDRFWSIKSLQYKYWANIIVSENIHASKILSQFDEDCVIEAFHNNECDVILTLKNEKLYRISKELQEKKNMLEATKEKVNLEIVSVNSGPRKVMGKTNKLNRLR